jgi:hypothetical protein
MSSSPIQGLFCSKIGDFSKDMMVILKDDPDSVQLLTTLDAMVTMSPDMIIMFFRDLIAKPYEKQILARDESFLRGELDKHVNNGPLDQIQKKIYEKWEVLNESQKNMIWDYFKILVVLSKRL